MNPRDMQLIREIDERRLDYSGETIGPDVCPAGKRTQQAHPTSAFQQAGPDAVYRQECTSTNMPQQNGVSERDGRTMNTMARCFIPEVKFPKSLWGRGFFFTAVCVANRSPQSSIGGEALFFWMHDKSADMSALQAIGSRAFGHAENHIPKCEDRAWEFMFSRLQYK